MIRKRIGNLGLLPDGIIRKIHAKNPNPGAFLKNCEDACRYAFEKNDKKVTEEHINKVLR